MFWVRAMDVKSSPLEKRRVSESGLGGGGENGEKRGMGVGNRGKGRYRTSQTKPSDAVCFFVLSSLITRSCRVADSRGAASWRSRIF